MDKNNKIKKRSIKRSNHGLKDPKKEKKLDLIYYYLPMSIAILIFIVDIIILLLIANGSIKVY